MPRDDPRRKWNREGARGTGHPWEEQPALLPIIPLIVGFPEGLLESELFGHERVLLPEPIQKKRKAGDGQWGHDLF